MTKRLLRQHGINLIHCFALVSFCIAALILEVVKAGAAL